MKKSNAFHLISVLSIIVAAVLMVVGLAISSVPLCLLILPFSGSSILFFLSGNATHAREVAAN